MTPADLYGSTDKYVVRGRRDISEEGLASSSAQLLPPGTVLFSSRAPIGYVAIAGASLATNQGFKSCSPYLPGLADYLYWFLKSSAKSIDMAASGTTFKEISGGEFSKVALETVDVRVQIEAPLRTTSGVKNINSTEVLRIRLALPPLAEQVRIVARVEELRRLCGDLRQRLTQARDTQSRLADALVAEVA